MYSASQAGIITHHTSSLKLLIYSKQKTRRDIFFVALGIGVTGGMRLSHVVYERPLGTTHFLRGHDRIVRKAETPCFRPPPLPATRKYYYVTPRLFLYCTYDSSTRKTIYGDFIRKDVMGTIPGLLSLKFLTFLRAGLRTC